MSACKQKIFILVRIMHMQLDWPGRARALEWAGAQARIEGAQEGHTDVWAESRAFARAMGIYTSSSDLSVVANSFLTAWSSSCVRSSSSSRRRTLLFADLTSCSSVLLRNSICTRRHHAAN